MGAAYEKSKQLKKKAEAVSCRDDIKIRYINILNRNDLICDLFKNQQHFFYPNI